MGHRVAKAHHYTTFQEIDEDCLELSMNLNYLKSFCVCSQGLLIELMQCWTVPFKQSRLHSHHN